MTNTLLTSISTQFETIVANRRYLHQHPELSFEETKTAQFIADQLRSYGIDVQTNVGGNGVIATIKGSGAGKTIAFRADFDALPIPDEKEVPYKSQNSGVSHACGHDGHTAALLGFAYVVNQNREHFKGNVKLIFQHAEEKPPGGAKAIIDAGVLDDVDAIFGAHVASDLPVGILSTRVGPSMGSVDAFKIKLIGRGGHGARPHQTKDSIVIGAQLITQLQQIVSRRIDPVEPAVVTIGRFESGNAFNVIADTAVLEGTVRSLNESVRAQIESEIRAILDSLKVSSYIDYELDYLNGYPTLSNHEKEANLVRQLIVKQFGPDAYVERPITLGAEDFSYYLLKKPGAFFFVGSHNESIETQYPHHHPKFDLDERSLLHIGATFLAIVEHYLIKEEK